MRPNAIERRGWQWSFKHKLWGAMAAMVALVLVATVIVLQHLIEKDAIRRIELDLHNTGRLVSGLIENRNDRLFELAVGLSGSELVRRVLTERSLDRLTRDDIIVNEVLPDYPRLSLLMVTDYRGTVLGGNLSSTALGEKVIRSPAFQAALAGDPGQGFAYHQERYLQLAALPLLIGPPEQSEVIGIVVVGMAWQGENLQRIGDLSQAKIALLHDDQVVLATADFRPGLLPRGREGVTSRFPDGLPEGSPQVRQVSDERFLLLRLAAQREAAPAFVIAKSLDRQIAFIVPIRRSLIQLGLGGMAVGVLLSLVLAGGISKPIHALETAVGQIEKGEYGHRVRIHSRDEFARLAQAFNQMAQGLSERDFIRNTFGRYIDKDVAQILLQRPETAKLGGERRTVVILMADIRGFTPLSEKLNPEVIVQLLNRYFARMIHVIKGRQGIVVDFVGDALLAFFNPLGGEIASIVQNGVQCAFDMHRQLRLLNEELTADGLPELNMGIGLNVGPAIVGNIGSTDRAKYGIVGSAVNVTHRIQGQARAGEVVVPDSVLRYSEKQLHVERSFETRLKGVSMPNRLHAIRPPQAIANRE